MADDIISSENIFKDLGFPNFDEESAKIVLASNIDRMIEVREMTQQEAAEFLGISQSKIRVLRNIQLEDFTLDRLFSLLKKLDPNIKKYLLEEYRELGLCWRHDDELLSKLTAVLLPLSVAALTLPYLKNGTPKFFAVVGGLMLMAYWFITACLCMRRIDIWFSRIRQIERLLGLYSHLSYYRNRASEVPPIISPELKFRKLRLCGFVLRSIFNKKCFQLLGKSIDEKFSFRVLRLRIFQLYVAITFFIIMLDIQVEAINPTFIQSVRVLFDEKVEAARWTIDLWPFFGLWSTDEWILKLGFTVEDFVFPFIAIIAFRGAEIIYRSTCPFPKKTTNPENKA